MTSRTPTRRPVCVAISLLLAGWAVGPVALAQVLAAAPVEINTLETVTVTATKRLEQAKDVPMAVSAISGQTLQDSGAVGFTDYAAKIPNLSFGYAGAGRQTSRLFQIRGIFGQDTSALYIGDASVPTSVDPRVMDVERVEVLRGPQGSLFGARSMGGLVRLVPNKPTTNQFAGNAHVSVGQTHKGGTSYAADTTLNVPLSDRSALRITAYHIDDAGWINRLVDPNSSMMAQLTTGAPTSVSGDEYLHKGVNSDRTNGFQAALRFDANDWLTISPRLMYQRTDSNGPPYVDGDVNSLVKIRQFDVNEKGMDEWTLANLEIAAAVRGGDFVSSTSYFKRSTMDVEDATRFIASRLGGRIRTAVAAPSTTTAAGEEKRATQEFRFVSESKGSFQYIVGAFFQRTERSGGYPADSIFPVGSPAIGVAGIAVGDSFFSLATTFKQTEIAAFGEMNYKIVPALTLTLGARAYDIKTDQTRLDGGVLFSKLYGFTVKPYAGSEKGSGINPRLALSWEQSKELTWYANAAMGYRPGRVNDSKGACTALGVTGVRDAVDADSLWNYEGGAKGSFFGGRLQTNVAAFYIDWKNRQTSTLDCGMGFGALDNVGAVRSRGAEFDVSYALGKGFGLSAAMGYTDARVTDIGNAIGVAVGNRLANAPRTNAAVGMNFSTALSGSTIGYGRIDARYVGDSISAQKAYRPEYTIVDLRAGAKFGMWDLSVFVKNAADKRANLSDAPELSDSLNLIAIERPRTIGIDLRAKF